MSTNTAMRVRCPGCGKEHVLPEVPAAPFKKRCLRCAETFAVNAEKSRASMRTDVPRPVEDAPGETEAASAPAGGSTSVHDILGSGASIDIGALEIGAVDTKKRPRSARKTSRDEPDVEGMPPEEEQTNQGPYSDEEAEEDGVGGADRRRPLWPLLSMLTAGGLLAAGAAWYFLAGPDQSTATRPLASSAPTSTTVNTAAPVTPAKAEPPKKIEPPPPSTAASSPAKAANAAPPSTAAAGSPREQPGSPAKANPVQMVGPIKLSAARLSAELAADSAGTKAKYAKKTLLVSGLLGRFDTAKLLAYFLGDPGSEVACDLAGSPPAVLLSWSNARGSKPITVRGELGDDLKLHQCEIVARIVPADEKYLGKEIEVVGYVAHIFPPHDDRAYPMLQLECDTDAKLNVECLFRKADEPELKKLQVGNLVTVSALCSGRMPGKLGPDYVRLDNCRLIYTTAPAPPTPRLDVSQLLRDYEEDMRPALRPSQPAAAGALTISAAQINEEFAATGQALQSKYKHKMLTVTGSLSRKSAPIVILEADSTKQDLKVVCYFTPHRFQELDDRTKYTIRGLCTGITDARMLRLDNCELVDDGQRRHFLTADYFPFKVGRTLTYDQAALQSDNGSPPILVRRVFSFQDGGTITTAITHTSRLPAGTRLSESLLTRDWISSGKVKKVYIEGPALRHRLSGGLVELGQQSNATTTSEETGGVAEWQPALKIGTKAGDTWKFSFGGANRQYTLIQFIEHKGRLAAIIKEIVGTTSQAAERTIQIRHVYVEGVGEVERQEGAILKNGQTRTMSIMKLVEDEESAPPKNSIQSKRSGNP